MGAGSKPSRVNVVRPSERGVRRTPERLGGVGGFYPLGPMMGCSVGIHLGDLAICPVGDGQISVTCFLNFNQLT